MNVVFLKHFATFFFILIIFSIFSLRLFSSIESNSSKICFFFVATTTILNFLLLFFLFKQFDVICFNLWQIKQINSKWFFSSLYFCFWKNFDFRTFLFFVSLTFLKIFFLILLFFDLFQSNLLLNFLFDLIDCVSTTMRVFMLFFNLIVNEIKFFLLMNKF